MSGEHQHNRPFSQSVESEANGTTRKRSEFMHLLSAFSLFGR